MKRSSNRILTTHTGSLPREADLVALMEAQEKGTVQDAAALSRRIDTAVDDIVRQQIACGLDIINDGEQSKPDYSTYIKHRLSGFSGEMERHPQSRDARDFPEFFAASRASQMNFSTRPCCTGPVAWKDFEAVNQDVVRFKASLERVGKSPVDAFMTAVSPGQAARFLGNRFYKSHEEYLRALAAVMKEEYDAIARAGFTLQVDCPDLASGWNNQFANATLTEFRDVVRLHLEVLDEATRDVPPDQLRLHLCWGNYAGPHTHDIPMRDIIDLVFASRAMAVSFEGANPRHAHEWRAFLDVRIPAGKMIIPGVIDSVSSFVEHPRAVADRIIRYAEVAGRENVMVGSDCGFATFAGSQNVHPTIVWAKMAALAEGAEIASKELWGG